LFDFSPHCCYDIHVTSICNSCQKVCESMTGDLTRGPVMGSMFRFAVPMILGNLLQQCYNITDTLIVSRFLGPDALAAVGSSYSLMSFLTSILLGLCMGSGAAFSIRFGRRDIRGLKEGMCAS